MIIECSSCSQELSYSTFYGLIGERLASIFANLRGSAQWDEFTKLLNTRSGGTYISPARLRAMQEAASLDKLSPEYQRLSWDALCKSITGIVNWVNITNIKQIVPELPVFYENLIRVRGLFTSMLRPPICRLRPFCCAPIINTKLPQVGESESWC